jgi:hypothetical protein
MRNEVDLVVAPSAQMCEKGAGRDLMTFAELYQAVGYVLRCGGACNPKYVLDAAWLMRSCVA